MASTHHEVVVGSYRWGRPPNVRKSIEAEDIIDVPKRWVGNASSSHTSVHEDDSSDASCPHEEAPKLHELRKFDEQASGHSVFFKMGEGRLAKPCNPQEALIYRHFRKEPTLMPFVAKFYGIIERLDNKTKAARKAQDSAKLIVLEDLTHGYEHPCVLDLKIGRKQYTRTCKNLAKRKRRDVKCAATTSRALGLRLGGIRVFRPATGGYVVRTGQYGKRLSEKTFVDALKFFLDNGMRTRLELIPPFTRLLKGLLSALETQKTFDFIASSVLLVYEGSETLPDVNQRPKVDVRLIDFDHAEIKGEPKETPISNSNNGGSAVQPQPEEEVTDYDDDWSGTKAGIKNLIKLFKQIERCKRALTHSNEDIHVVEQCVPLKAVRRMDSDPTVISKFLQKWNSCSADLKGNRGKSLFHSSA